MKTKPLFVALFSIACAGTPTYPEPELPLTVSQVNPSLVAPPRVAPARLLQPPQLQSKVLDNGLLVIVAEEPERARTAVAYVNRRAREVYASEQAGVAALTARSLGASDATAPEAEVFAWTRVSQRGTTLRVVSRNSDVVSLVEQLSARLLRGNFRAEMLRKARDGLAAATEGRRYEEASALRRKALEALYGSDHPLLRERESLEHNAEALPLSAIEAFFSKNYGGFEAALIFSGGTKAEDAFALAQRYFAEMKRGPAEPAHTAQPPVIDERSRPIWLLSQPGNSSTILVALPCAPRGSGDELAFEVVSALLTTVNSSDFALRIRHDSGVSYERRASCSSLDDGVFYFNLSADPARTGEALSKVLAQLERLTTNPITEAERESALMVYLSGQATELGTTSDLADALAQAFLAGEPIHYFERLEARARALTAADLNAVIRRYFSDRKRAIVVRGPENVVPQLHSHGSVRLAN